MIVLLVQLLISIAAVALPSKSIEFDEGLAGIERFVADGYRHFFLEFYAPWCQHCQAFAPTWEEVGRTLHELAPRINIVVGKLDGLKHKTIMQELRGDRFPHLVFLKINDPADLSNIGVTVYRGYRNLPPILEFVVRMTERAVYVINSTALWRQFVDVPTSHATRVALALVLPTSSVKFVDESIERIDALGVYRSFTLAASNNIDRDAFGVTTLEHVAADDVDHALLSSFFKSNETLGVLVCVEDATRRRTYQVLNGAPSMSTTTSTMQRASARALVLATAAFTPARVEQFVARRRHPPLSPATDGRLDELVDASSTLVALIGRAPINHSDVAHAVECVSTAAWLLRDALPRVAFLYVDASDANFAAWLASLHSSDVVAPTILAIKVHEGVFYRNAGALAGGASCAQHARSRFSAWLSAIADDDDDSNAAAIRTALLSSVDDDADALRGLDDAVVARIAGVGRIQLRHAISYYWQREPVLVIGATALVISFVGGVIAFIYLWLFRTPTLPPSADRDNDDEKENEDEKKTK